MYRYAFRIIQNLAIHCVFYELEPLASSGGLLKMWNHRTRPMLTEPKFSFWIILSVVSHVCWSLRSVDIWYKITYFCCCYWVPATCQVLHLVPLCWLAHVFFTKKYYKEKELSLISKIRKLAGREFRQHSLIMSETILRARLFFFKHHTFFSPHYLALYACFTRGPSRK